MKSAASVNGIAQETQKKRIKSPVGVPQELSRKRGRNGKKSSAGRIRRRRKGGSTGCGGGRQAGMGGRSGGEELAEAPAKANGERKERREIFGGKQGEGGGPRWTWGLLVRAGNFQRARDRVAGEPPGEGAHVQRNASLPGFFFLLFCLLERGSPSHFRC